MAFADEFHMQNRISSPDFIGMGSYNSDSHDVQTRAYSGSFSALRGGRPVPGLAVGSTYRSILPKTCRSTNPHSSGMSLGDTPGTDLHAYGTTVHDRRQGCRKFPHGQILLWIDTLPTPGSLARRNVPLSLRTIC